MSDLQEQLAQLRRRIASIDRKYASARKPEVPRLDPPEGREVETERGKHWEMERFYARHRRHGSMDISTLAELPEDLLDAISSGAIAKSKPEEWAFLDTETTGLVGGSGTYAFLIGVGRITAEGFHVRQFFIRDYDEEPSQLAALAAHLEPFRVLITYNGKTFDQPLLETRFRMMRSKPPFARMEHLDLLAGARRLWNLRFENCRLMHLENQILGFEREGDIAGELIPHLYFEYLRTRIALRLIPIFHHNAIDVLTLACLTGIVPYAFREFDSCSPLRHGAEMVGLARWYRQAERHESALELFHRAVDRGLPDDLLFRTLWDVALLERKLGREAAAVAVWTDLAASRNPFRVAAYEQLAKFYEHRERNHSMALEMTRAAIAHEDSPALRKREARLASRIARCTASVATPRLL
ncbi:MAG TPA: ribonuclease H-like domain-containing protein [Bryobacteraceae bacterium]|nr:ribonuclease H-like domain-containing protein [Bryobacteraceae bacterium]